VIFCAHTCPYRWPVLMGCMYGSCGQSTRTHPYLRPIFTGLRKKALLCDAFSVRPVNTGRVDRAPVHMGRIPYTFSCPLLTYLLSNLTFTYLLITTSSAIRCNVLWPVGTVGAHQAGGAVRHADAVNYGRQVVHLVAGWSFMHILVLSCLAQ